MLLPIGYDNFQKVIEKKLDFVDKTLFIKEVIEDRTTEVAVITRPRRFGKTFNLSMLQHFLASEAYGRETHGLFEGLKISDYGNEYMQYQGKYPVVFITLKDIKHTSFKASYEKLIDEHTVFQYLNNNASAVWNLLLMAGYLKPAN